MVAVDVMGSDVSVGQLVRGALGAHIEGHVPICFFGKKLEIEAELEKLSVACSDDLMIVDCQQVVEMDGDPVRSIKDKPFSSLVQAVSFVAQGRCRAVVSASHSGAYMVATSLLLEKEIGIDRPAIAGILPSVKGGVVVLDIGVNVVCRPHNIMQFALLGLSYASALFGDKRSLRVGLLSNGVEEGKGSPLEKSSFTLLKETLGYRFYGNVEPGDIFNHTVDVVVTDGFTGNVLLKAIESSLEFFTNFFKVPHDRVESLIAQHDRGALLLGLKQPVIVCHGKSSEETFARAVSLAWQAAGGVFRKREKIVQKNTKNEEISDVAK